MKPDGEKHSSFRMQNNLGGAKLLTDKIVSAIQSQGLEGVVIGMEATSVYGDSLVYALRDSKNFTKIFGVLFFVHDNLALTTFPPYTLIRIRVSAGISSGIPYLPGLNQ